MAFTPRQFPIDPFDDEPPLTLPWSLDPSTLPDHTLLANRDNVLLVLGEPPLDAIAPLLSSATLAASLVILATSRNYSLPISTVPAVRLLRLGVPLASSDSAASRLAAVLQWADRIATAWRATPHAPSFEEFIEDSIDPQPHRSQTPSQRTSWFVNNASLSSSHSDVALSLSRNLTPPRRSHTPELPFRTPTTRIFDALFDFLPPDAPDRHLLKHAILVTTLSRPFFTTPSLPSPPPSPPKSHRFSFRRSAVILPASLPRIYTSAHIVHLVPTARAALVRPLESFCLSFSYPAHGPLDIPRPYIMPPTALRDILYLDSRPWTLVELILCGVLDGEKPHRRGSLRNLAKTHRACILGVSDITLTGSAPVQPLRQRRSAFYTRPSSVIASAVLTPLCAAHPQHQREVTQAQAQAQAQTRARASPPPRPSRSIRRTSTYASTSLKSIPSASSLSTHAHTHVHTHAPHPSPTPAPSLRRPRSAATPSHALQPPSPPPPPNTPLQPKPQPPDPKNAASVWPTPPSSTASSSASSSPNLGADSPRGVEEVGAIIDHVGARMQMGSHAHGHASSLQGMTSDASMRSRTKRRGLLSWMKR